MNIKRNILCVAVAAASTFILSSAYAGWDTGGWGVVVFDQNVNPGKIIFSDQVRPAEAQVGMGTDRTGYNSMENFSDTHGFRNVTPVGLTPTQYFDPNRSGADAKRIDSYGPIVWSQVSKSAGAPCKPNQAGCASPGAISGNSTCSFHTVKITGQADISIAPEKAIKINSEKKSASIGGGVSVTASWEQGWQSCQTEASLHTCPPGSFLSFNSVAYATTEVRSRYGWHDFTTSGNTLYFKDRYHTADVNNCESKLHGNYIAGGFLIEPKVGRCVLNNTNSVKPTWERFERLPIPDSASVPPLVPQCRYIKGG